MIQFQKKVGEHNECYSLPQRIIVIRSGICEKAKTYFRRQFYFMLGLTAVVILAFPGDKSDWGRDGRNVPQKVM